MTAFKRLGDWADRLAARPRIGWIVQFVKFGLVGVSNTLIHLAIYYLCVYAFGLHYQPANLIAFLVSVLNAYFWNSRYVFSSRAKRSAGVRTATLFKTLCAYAATYLTSLFLLWLWVEKLHVSEAVAPLINLCITVPLNYLINKFWTFREKKTDDESV